MTQNSRTGEKIGWIGGWAGGFIWVLLVACLLIAQGRLSEGIPGLIIVVAAALYIPLMSPWRHPRVTYRLLMLPIYGLLVASLAWGLWILGGFSATGMSPFIMLVLLPMLVPLKTVGGRRWNDIPEKNHSLNVER